MLANGEIAETNGPLVHSYCRENRRLMEEFAATVKELFRLHEEQFYSILDGDEDCNRFDVLLHMANEKKQQAKYAYLRHVESHGCWNADVLSICSGTRSCERQRKI
jgi:hypothetical protein